MPTKLERILDRVSKPARYTGGEYGSIIKNPADAAVRFAFCFPDVYDVGMSHLGLRLLYHLLNEREDTYCERVFSPWPDMAEEMKKEGVPLFTLETKTPVREFDIFGFTLLYEMCYTNVLTALDLAGIPRRSADRGEDDPIVCAGGPCTYNPEPLADFIDFFCIGEGEEQMNDIIDVYKKCKEKHLSRAETLKAISKIDGIYVPSYYDVTFEGEKQTGFEPKYDDVPRKIRKRIVSDFNKAYVPETCIVPFTEIVHDRVTVELFRGCIRGCRFCQAGNIYRPIRERSPHMLAELAKKLIKATGYDEVSLCSLSTSDYSGLREFTDELLEFTEPRKVNLALPSLRIDNFSMGLMERVQKVRKSGMTFAPEAGTQRMRDIINKGITEEDIMSSARLVFSGGYKSVKLYFMIGLPYETDEDVAGIPRLAKKVVDVYFEEPRPAGKNMQITASVSSFVPKAFTPFQWARQNSREELRAKQKILVSTQKSKRVRINYHESAVSVLEGVFARGDRRLCRVLEEAVDRGCNFDAWSEYFLNDKWLEAFEACGLKPEVFTRERSYDELLPWDMIDIGITKNHLMRENERAARGELTPNCRVKCAGCGAASFKAGVCVE